MTRNGGRRKPYTYFLSFQTKDHGGLRSSSNTWSSIRPDHAEMALMLTSATLQFFEGHEADECDCPACLPACERTRRRCFIVCDRCQAKVEADEIAPLKSATRRVHYTSTTAKG